MDPPDPDPDLDPEEEEVVAPEEREKKEEEVVPGAAILVSSTLSPALKRWYGRLGGFGAPGSVDTGEEGSANLHTALRYRMPLGDACGEGERKEGMFKSGPGLYGEGLLV